MKKVIPILLVLFILLTSTCFAAYEPDPNRWIWISSDKDKVNYFIDIETVQYSNNGDTVNFWVCAVESKKSFHSFQNAELSYTNRTITLLYFADYKDKKHKPIASRAYKIHEQTPEPIVPNSIAETFYRYFFPN